MKKCILIIAALLPLLYCPAKAQDWRVRSPLRFGVEWGYSLSVYKYYHFNYIEATDGYRVDDEGSSSSWLINAYGVGMVGVDLSRYLNLSLNIGLTGIYRGRNVYSASIRGSWYFSNVNSSGFFIYSDGGLGISEAFDEDFCALMHIGGGYRISLSRRSDLDLSLSFRSALDHPEIWDEWEGKYVEKRNIRRNNALYYALCFGIGISF